MPDDRRGSDINIYIYIWASSCAVNEFLFFNSEISLCRISMLARTRMYVETNHDNNTTIPSVIFVDVAAIIIRT